MENEVDDKLEATEVTENLDNLEKLEQDILAEKDKPTEPEVKEESVEEAKEEKETSATEVLKEETTQQDDSDKQPEPELPEKYRGKSAQDIIKMHQESEKMMHSKSQESSRYRKMLADKVDFDEDGNIVGIKQPTKEQPTQSQEDYWATLEEQTSLPRQTIQALMTINEARFRQQGQQFEQLLQPLRKTQSQSTYDRLKTSMRGKEEYKHLDEVEDDIDAFVKERKIPLDQIRDETAMATLYYTALGKRFDKKIEKKKADTKKLKEVSEQEKTEAQVSTSTKAVTEGKKDINTMSLEELEKNLPQQEL